MNDTGRLAVYRFRQRFLKLIEDKSIKIRILENKIIKYTNKINQLIKPIKKLRKKRRIARRAKEEREHSEESIRKRMRDGVKAIKHRHYLK